MEVAANHRMPSGITMQKLVPQEALDYLVNRGAKLTETLYHDAIWQEEHLNQFTISRLASLDLMQDLHDELVKNMREGLRLQDFQKSITPKLQAAGWWGVKEVVDRETGEILKTRFNPARLMLIYDTNMSMAYSVGKWARAQANKERFPYIVYMTQRDERVRKSHQSWEGIALPVDHPFWDTHYPPNDYRCRCYVIFADEKMLAKLVASGIKIKREPPDIIYVKYVNKATGETSQTPAGLAPNFAYNVGKSAQSHLLEVTRQKLEKSTTTLASVVVGSLARSDAFKAWYNKPDGSWPILKISDDDAQLLGSKETVAQLSPDTAIKQKDNHADILPEDYDLIQHAVDYHTHKIFDSPNSLIYIWDASDDKNGFVVIVKSTKSRLGLFLTSYRKLSRDALKKDDEIRRLLKKSSGR